MAPTRRKMGTVGLLYHLWCWVFGHEPDNGTNRWDIPFHPWAIPPKFRKDNFVAKTQYVCERCGETTDFKFGHRQDRPARYPLFPEREGDIVDVPPTPEEEVDFESQIMKALKDPSVE